MGGGKYPWNCYCEEAKKMNLGFVMESSYDDFFCGHP